MTLTDQAELTVGDSDGTPLRSSATRRLIVFLLGLLSGVAAILIGLIVLLDSEDPSLLLSASDGRITRLDSETGQTIFSVTESVIAPDGSAVYRVDESNDRPVVQRIDPISGVVQSEQAIPTKLAVRVVGVGGTAAVLTPVGQGSKGLYAPVARETTDLTVVWKDGRDPKTFNLTGNFEPETFTVDGSVLYLLEFIPATDPDHYLVRKLDLGTGEITDVYSPEVELNPEMRGHARAQVVDPAGTFMYTLYTLGNGQPLKAEGETRYGFVHVISLTKDWSYCIFLPEPIGQRESAMGLAMDPGGEFLYVMDSVAQIVAEIDTGKLEVTRSASIPLQVGGPSGKAPMAVSTEAGRLFITDGFTVFAVELETMNPTLGWNLSAPPPAEIIDIRISNDGRELWVLTQRQIHVVDLGEMAAVRKITVTADDGAFVDAEVPATKFDDISKFVCVC